MEIVGLMAFLVIAALTIRSVVTALETPAVQTAIRDIAPFLGDHASTLAIVAGVVLAIIAIAIPPIIKSRESREVGPGAFEKLGTCFALVMGLLSVGYLVGTGLLAASTILA